MGRSLVLSLVGAVLVSPIPIFAGAPDLIPEWSLARALGAPVLSWLLVLLMAALVGVAVISASALGSSDD